MWTFFLTTESGKHSCLGSKDCCTSVALSSRFAAEWQSKGATQTHRFSLSKVTWLLLILNGCKQHDIGIFTYLKGLSSSSSTCLYTQVMTETHSTCTLKPWSQHAAQCSCFIGQTRTTTRCQVSWKDDRLLSNSQTTLTFRYWSWVH